ncbi:hypothetical protein FD755_016180, partial [Muntiacus reevesi]
RVQLLSFLFFGFFSCSLASSGLPFPSPGDLPNSGIEPMSLRSFALAGALCLKEKGLGPCEGQVRREEVTRKCIRNEGRVSGEQRTRAETLHTHLPSGQYPLDRPPPRTCWRGVLLLTRPSSRPSQTASLGVENGSGHPCTCIPSPPDSPPIPAATRDLSSLQEWIKDTQNVAPLNKMEDGELECAPEDAVVVQPAEAETPKTVVMASPLYPQTGEEEAAGDSGQLPGQQPQGRGVISLGDFTFVMSDNSYMML